ncbi:MAG: type II secretion system protein [Gammaproteobacteria bacterium]|nr:type II secretion system protein [Gammaproteobacteria bacterium]
MAIRDGQRGFTLWELIVVISLVVFLFAVAMENLLPLRGAAERAQVLHTEGALRSALGMQASQRVVQQGSRGLKSLTRENPLDWLAVPPTASAAETLEGLQPGTWSWISHSNILAYRLRYPEYVEAAHEGEWLRYKVVFEENEARQPMNLALVALDPVRWDLPQDVIATSQSATGEMDDDSSN